MLAPPPLPPILNYMQLSQVQLEDTELSGPEQLLCLACRGRSPCSLEKSFLTRGEPVASTLDGSWTC